MANFCIAFAPPLLFGEAGRAPLAVSIMPRRFPQGIGIMTGKAEIRDGCVSLLSQNMNIRLE
jgi:hypothetical protein